MSKINDRTGESKTLINGLVVTITKYRSCRDIDLKYSDGTVITHSSYSNFKRLMATDTESKYIRKDKWTNGRRIPCEDHLGNKYPSKTAMLKAYGISNSVFMERLGRGLSLKEALTFKGNANYKTLVKDHLGNDYPTERAMCNAYNIKQNAFQRRINEGWSLEDALTKPVISTTQRCMDHLGNMYINKSEMCKAWGVRRETVNSKLRKGISLKDALETKQNPPKKDPKRYIGAHKTARCGLNMTVLNYIKGGRLLVEFEDGTTKQPSTSSFDLNNVGHQTLKVTGRGSFMGFKTKPLIKNEDGIITHYECECKKCGLKDILTPKEMTEHSKLHE